MSQSEGNIESILHENRTFDPPAPSGAPWLIGSLDEYKAIHKRSIEDPGAYWGEVAEGFHWFHKWKRVVSYEAPDAKWFVGGTTNLALSFSSSPCLTSRSSPKSRQGVTTDLKSARILVFAPRGVKERFHRNSPPK